MNEGRVYFSLDGDDFDPNKVTALLGIKPTSVVNNTLNLTYRSKYSWELSTPNIIAEYINVYEMADSIISLLKPKKDKILQIIREYDVTPRLQVVLWISTNDNHSMPAIGFEKETLKFLGEIGAFIDIDTYKH